MKRGLWMWAVAVCIGASGSAFAAAYGDAGCGLGSMVFGSSPGIKQVLAATTNGTFASQTFGITTGTSNCGSGVVGSAVLQEDFVRVNYASLSRDAATGGGEYLAAYATLLGCAVESQPVFFRRAQESVETLFTVDAAAKDIVSHTKLLIATDTALSAACGI